MVGFYVDKETYNSLESQDFAVMSKDMLDQFKASIEPPAPPPQPDPPQDTMGNTGDLLGNAGRAIGDTMGNAGQAIGSGLQVVQDAIPTTADISNPTQYGGSPSTTLDDIYRIAKQTGHSDEGARTAMAIAQTEGGLNGAAGDSGQSTGPFQFYSGTQGPGQLDNYAAYLKTDIATARDYARQHPAEAVQWALTGYLGNAIKQGESKGLTGADLATYAQDTGQVSKSPGRAGQNYNALFSGAAQGGGAPSVFPVAGYKGDVAQHWGSNSGGSDLFAAEGTPVVAMRGGKVISSSTDAIGGNAVLIQGDDGNQYYYAHLYQPPAVKAGQAVVAGDYLGGVGDTGNAKGTGAHLHMGIGPGIVNGSGPQGGTGGDFNAVGLLQNTLAQAGKVGGDLLGNVGRAVGDAAGQAGQAVGDVAAPVEDFGASLMADFRAKINAPPEQPTTQLPDTQAQFNIPAEPTVQPKDFGADLMANFRASLDNAGKTVGDVAGQTGEAIGGAFNQGVTPEQAVGDAWNNSGLGQAINAGAKIGEQIAPAIVQGVQEQVRSAPLGQAINPYTDEEAAARVASDPLLQTMADQNVKLGMDQAKANRAAIADTNLAMGIGDNGIGKVGKAAGRGGRPALDSGMIHSAALDVGNNSMRKGGRTVWNEADNAAAAAEYERLSPTPANIVATQEQRTATEAAAAEVGGAAKAAEGVAPRRFYHGTNADFSEPDPLMFQNRELYGPGYYLSSDPRAASNYATEGRAAESITGPNVRPVDILANAKLLDDLTPLPSQEFNHIAATVKANVPPEDYGAFMDELPFPKEATGSHIWSALHLAGIRQGDATALLEKAGYDGILHAGGQNRPLLDEAGAAISHQNLVIFPGSLPKITHPLSAGDIPPIKPPVKPPPPPSGMPAGGALPDFAGNVRLSKYEPDVQQIVLDAHAAGAGDLQATRRGVMSADELKSLADQVGTNAGAIVKTWQPGDAANAETLYALRQTLAGQSKRLLDAQKVYGAVDSTENLASLTEELARQKTIQDVVAGVTSEAGRGLWQFTRKIEGTDAATRIQQFIKFTGNRFTPEELGGVMKGVNFEDPIAVAKTTRELFVPTIKDKLTALWYFNLLSAPTTHIKNTVSNAVTLAGKPIEAAIAAPIDVARVGIGRALGKDVQREHFVGEAPANVAGMLASVQEGVLSALQIMRHGYTKSEAAAKIDIGMREAFSGRLADLTVNVPGRSLRASDVFFRSMNKTAEIYGQAFRIAKQEGRTGQAFTDRVVELRTNPLPEMVKAAEKEGAYRVFQQDGKFINAATALRSKVGVTRLVVPFIQTPYNITKYILERSPLGYAGVAVDAAAGKIVSGGNLSDRLARASMGSAIFASIYADAAAGNITGAAPTGAEGDAFYRQGKQPYSFKVGDKWYSYQALQPFSTLFAAAAAVSKAADKGQDQDAIVAAAQVSLAMGRSLTDMPWTQGLADVLEAYQDPERFGAAYANKFVTGFTPGSAFWRWVARSTDQTLRDPNNPIESVMANLPGLSANVPARLDAMGMQVQRSAEQTGIGALNTFNPSAENTDPVETELARLQAKGLKVQPSFVGTNMTIGKEMVPLKRDEVYEYQRVSGQLAHGFLLSVVGTPEWNALSDKDKAKQIDLVFTSAREFQRTKMQPQVQPRAAQQWYDRTTKETGTAPNLAPAAPAAQRAPIAGTQP